jgi:hypothetical protein
MLSMLLSHWSGAMLEVVTANTVYSSQRVASESVFYKVMLVLVSLVTLMVLDHPS